jgi:hypothetical protein
LKWRLEWRLELGARSKVEGQRSRDQSLEAGLESESEQKKSVITKVPGFMKGSTESN